MSALSSAGTIGALVLTTATLLTALSALPVAHEARAAADAAALAAATAHLWWGSEPPCRLADRVARANRSALRSCRCTAEECEVWVRSWFLGITIDRTARAGPQPGIFG